MLDLFSMPTYNGKYLRPNSAKPIAGVCTLTAYKRPLVQAKVSSDYAIPGTAVSVTTSAAGETNAGTNLNPNVLVLDGKTAVTATTFSGFVVSSPTDVQPEGSKGAFAIKNQIVDVALLGSQAELYLPIKTGEGNSINVASAAVYWDATNNELTTTKKDTNIAIANLRILSQIVDGVKLKFNSSSNTAEYEDCKVVKVKLG